MVEEGRDVYCRKITGLLWEYIFGWRQRADSILMMVDTSLKKQPLSPKEWKLVLADLDHRVTVLEKMV